MKNNRKIRVEVVSAISENCEMGMATFADFMKAGNVLKVSMRFYISIFSAFQIKNNALSLVEMIKIVGKAFFFVNRMKGELFNSNQNLPEFSQV